MQTRSINPGAIRWAAVVASVLFSGACSTQQDGRPVATRTAMQSKTDGPRPDTVLGRGIAYLLSQQADDDLWHSPNYGNLRDGAAITSFVLYALAHCPRDDVEPHRQSLQRAVDRLVPAIRKRGYVTNQEGADYSNYASAMLLIAVRRLELELASDDRDRLLDYLCRAQLGETQGYQPDDDDHGGWDLAGWQIGSRRTTGTNISVSSIVIECLAEAGEIENQELSSRVETALDRAATWLARCQNRRGDGGFYFHPEKKHLGNKAGMSNGQRSIPRSYATTTCDGFRCLNYLGVGKDSAPLVAARRWIESKMEFERVPGFEHSEDQSWAQGLRYYYYFSLAKSLDWLDDSVSSNARKRMIQELKGLQESDGHWENGNARMREDDPIIATAFAVIAIAAIQSSTPSESR